MNGFTSKVLKALGLAATIACLVVAPALGSTNLYGAVDPWAYNAVQGSSAIELVTEHSVGQNATARPILVPLRVPLRVPVSTQASAFRLRDAGIGAATAVAAMFALVAAVVLRRRRVVRPVL